MDLNATAASLLGFLLDRPSSGYELCARLDASVGRFWNTTQSQVYRELARLAGRGYLRVVDKGPRERRSYAVTPEGRETFGAWLREMPGPIIARFPLLLTVFFADRLPRERFYEILRAHRTQSEALVREYRRHLPSLEGDRPYPAATMRLRLAYEESIIRWIDELLSE